MRKNCTYFFHFIILCAFLISSQNTRAQYCSGKTTLTSQSGNISDGSSANNYQANANCEWLIQPTGATSISLIFTDFETEGCCDFVEVYDGSSTASPLIGTYSGNTIPPVISSSTGSLYILFYSDPTSQKAGWNAYYTSCTPAIVPTISHIGPTSFCKGDSVILVSSKGNSYLWSQGATTRKITVKNSGSYSVFVTDSNSCMAATSPISVNSISTTASITHVGNTSICKGDSVQLIGNFSSGSQYQWLLNGKNIIGATGTNFFADSSGVYSLKITNGPCSANSNLITIQVNTTPAIPKISANGPTTFCMGSSVTLTSNTAANYAWSTGATTKSIVVSNSGSYTVTTTNGTCSSTSLPFVVKNAGPFYSASANPSSICSGGKTNLNAAANPSNGLSYSWAPTTGLSNPNIANPVATVNANTTYQVTVTDSASGCSSSSLVVVTVFTPPAAAVSPTGPINACQGNPVTLSANTADSYLWSNGSTTQTIIVNTSNTYSVVVTYAGGCKSTSNAVLVNINPAPSVSISANGSTNLCQGDSVELVASAPIGSTYQWFNYGIAVAGATSSNYWANNTGNFSVQVSSSANCSTSSNSIYISANSSSGSITAFGNTSFCAGDSVQLYFSGYGITYQWTLNNVSIPGATSYYYYATTSGSYNISVLDYNGCNTISIPVNVTVLNQQNLPVITPSGPTNFCNGQNVILSSSSAGTYLWNTGETTQNIIVIKSGTYTVTVGNPGNMCVSKSAPITVMNSTPIVYASATQDTICVGGTIQLDVNAGSSMTENFDPINSSQWSNIILGTVGSSGCGSVSGDALYFDGNGTRSAETIDMNVTAGGQISFSLVIGNSSYPCEMADYGEDVLLEYSTDGGVSWNNINTYLTGGTYANFTQIVENIPAGAQTPHTRFKWSQPFNSGLGFDNWTIDDITINGISSGNNYSYSWTPTTGLNDSHIKSPLALINSNIQYTVTVTDTSTKCAGTSTIYITAVNPGASINASGPTTFCLGNYVILNASPGSSYLWSNGATTQNVTITQSGSYTVAVTNPYGCSGTYTSSAIQVNATSVPTAIITLSGPTAFCPGGSVTLQANGGTSFQWSNGATTQSIAVNQAGTYSVVITNAGGCNGPATSAPVTISTLPLPNIPVISQNGNTMYSSAGSGNQWYFNFQPISGANLSSYLASQNGVYSVLYTDPNGCTAMSTPYTMVTGIEENSLLENSFQVFPNPFLSEAQIAFSLQSKTYAQLCIYNMLGVKINTLMDEIKSPGKFILNVKNLPSGAYILILKTDDKSYVKKIVSME